MKMQRFLWIVLGILGCSPTPGICYNKHRDCADGYEFIIHERKRTFDSANRACTNEGFELAKIDSLKKTELINKYLKNHEASWIGLKHENGSWRWRDWTIAPPSSSTGYHNWARGEPNNINYNCVIIDSGNRKWTDFLCSSQYFQFFYICHKRIQFNITVNPGQLTIVEPGKYEISCTSGYLSCTSAPLRWEKNGNFLKDTDHLVFQVTNISVAGTYTCQGTADGMTKSKTAHVSVSGSPTQVRLFSVACDSNLKIEWKVNPLSIGFPHKIQAYPDFNLRNMAIERWITPQNEKQALELSKLIPLTNYTVEITACPRSYDCPTINMNKSTASTNGVPNSVENVELKIEVSQCSISWTRPGIIGDQILGYEITLLERIGQYRVPSADNYSVRTSNHVSFAFTPLPNRNYTTSLKAISCGGKSAAVNAAGFCYRPPQAPNQLIVAAESDTRNGTRYLHLEVPSEDNGLISCLIVIVSSQMVGGVVEREEPIYTSACLENMLERYEDYNIAVAIPPKKFAFKSGLDIALGDNTTSWCAPHLTSHISSDKNYMDENNDRCHNRIITARNKILNDSIAYKVYAVAVVPNGKELSFRRSMVTILRQSANPSTEQPSIEEENRFNFENFLLGFGVASLLFAAILLVWKLVSLNKCKKIRSVSVAAGNLDPKVNEVYEDADQAVTGLEISSKDFQPLQCHDNDHGYSEIATPFPTVQSSSESGAYEPTCQ